MSQEKNATDDPSRSPPDQGGAVNRSFSIHEIGDMSDDDAEGYRAALDERAARRARRCALSAPQAAEAPAHPTAARSPDQPAPTPSGSGNAVSSRRGQHRAIEDGTAGLKPAPTSTGNTTPIEDGTAAESAPTSTYEPEDGTAAEPAPTSTAEPEPESPPPGGGSNLNQDADVKIVEEPRTPPGRGDTTEADFNLARANLSATLASHEKAGVTVFRPASTIVRMDDGTDVTVPAGPTVLSEIAAQRRQHTAGFRGNGVVPENGTPAAFCLKTMLRAMTAKGRPADVPAKPTKYRDMAVLQGGANRGSPKTAPYSLRARPGVAARMTFAQQAALQSEVSAMSANRSELSAESFDRAVDDTDFTSSYHQSRTADASYRGSPDDATGSSAASESTYGASTTDSSFASANNVSAPAAADALANVAAAAALGPRSAPAGPTEHEDAECRVCQTLGGEQIMDDGLCATCSDDEQAQLHPEPEHSPIASTLRGRCRSCPSVGPVAELRDGQCPTCFESAPCGQCGKLFDITAGVLHGPHGLCLPCLDSVPCNGCGEPFEPSVDSAPGTELMCDGCLYSAANPGARTDWTSAIVINSAHGNRSAPPSCADCGAPYDPRHLPGHELYVCAACYEARLDTGMADVFGATSSFSAEHGSHEEQSEQALSEEQVTALMTGDTPDTVARLATVLGYMLKRSKPYYPWFHTTVRKLLVCCRFDPSGPGPDRLFDWDVDDRKADWEALQLATAGNWCIPMPLPESTEKIVCQIVLMGDQGEVLVVYDPVQGHLLPSAEQTAQSEHPSARTAALHGVETVISMPNSVRKDVYKALARQPDLSVNAPVGDLRRLTIKVWLVRTASTALKLCSVNWDASGTIEAYNERNALPLDQCVDRLTVRPHGRWELRSIQHSDLFHSSCEVTAYAFRRLADVSKLKFFAAKPPVHTDPPREWSVRRSESRLSFCIVDKTRLDVLMTTDCSNPTASAPVDDASYALTCELRPDDAPKDAVARELSWLPPLVLKRVYAALLDHPLAVMACNGARTRGTSSSQTGIYIVPVHGPEMADAVGARRPGYVSFPSLRARQAAGSHHSCMSTSTLDIALQCPVVGDALTSALLYVPALLPPHLASRRPHVFNRVARFHSELFGWSDVRRQMSALMDKRADLCCISGMCCNATLPVRDGKGVLTGLSLFCGMQCQQEHSRQSKVATPTTLINQAERANGNRWVVVGAGRLGELHEHWAQGGLRHSACYIPDRRRHVYLRLAASALTRQRFGVKCSDDVYVDVSVCDTVQEVYHLISEKYRVAEPALLLSSRHYGLFHDQWLAPQIRVGDYGLSKDDPRGPLQVTLCLTGPTVSARADVAAGLYSSTDLLSSARADVAAGLERANAARAHTLGTVGDNADVNQLDSATGLERAAGTVAVSSDGRSAWNPYQPANNGDYPPGGEPACVVDGRPVSLPVVKSSKVVFVCGDNVFGFNRKDCPGSLDTVGGKRAEADYNDQSGLSLPAVTLLREVDEEVYLPDAVRRDLVRHVQWTEPVWQQAVLPSGETHHVAVWFLPITCKQLYDLRLTHAGHREALNPRVLPLYDFADQCTYGAAVREVALARGRHPSPEDLRDADINAARRTQPNWSRDTDEHTRALRDCTYADAARPDHWPVTVMLLYRDPDGYTVTAKQTDRVGTAGMYRDLSTFPTVTVDSQHQLVQEMHQLAQSQFPHFSQEIGNAIQAAMRASAHAGPMDVPVVRAGRGATARLLVYVVDVPHGALALGGPRLPHGASSTYDAPSDFTLHVRYLDDDLELCRQCLRPTAVQACSEQGSPLRALLEQAVDRADTLRDRAGGRNFSPGPPPPPRGPPPPGPEVVSDPADSGPSTGTNAPARSPNAYTASDLADKGRYASDLGTCHTLVGNVDVGRCRTLVAFVDYGNGRPDGARVYALRSHDRGDPHCGLHTLPCTYMQAPDLIPSSGFRNPLKEAALRCVYQTVDMDERTAEAAHRSITTQIPLTACGPQNGELYGAPASRKLTPAYLYVVPLPTDHADRHLDRLLLTDGARRTHQGEWLDWESLKDHCPDHDGELLQTWWPAIVTRLRSGAPAQLQVLPRGLREAHQDCAEDRRQDGRRGDNDEGNSGPPAKTVARLFSDHGEGPRENQRAILERAPTTPPRKKANRALPLMEEAALIIVGGIAPRTESGQVCVTFCSKPITERQQAKDITKELEDNAEAAIRLPNGSLANVADLPSEPRYVIVIGRTAAAAQSLVRFAVEDVEDKALTTTRLVNFCEDLFDADFTVGRGRLPNGHSEICHVKNIDGVSVFMVSASAETLATVTDSKWLQLSYQGERTRPLVFEPLTHWGPALSLSLIDSASQFRRLAVEGDLGEPALFGTPGSSPGSFLNQSGHGLPAGQPHGSRTDGVKRQTEAQVKAKLVQVMKAPCKMFADKFMGTGRESVRKLLIIFQGLEGTSSDYRVFQSDSLHEQCWSIFTENHCGAKPLAYLWEQLALWRETNRKPVSYPAPTTWLGWITEQYQQPDQVDEHHAQIVQVMVHAPYPDPQRQLARIEALADDIDVIENDPRSPNRPAAGHSFKMSISKDRDAVLMLKTFANMFERYNALFLKRFKGEDAAGRPAANLGLIKDVSELDLNVTAEMKLIRLRQENEKRDAELAAGRPYRIAMESCPWDVCTYKQLQEMIIMIWEDASCQPHLTHWQLPAKSRRELYEYLGIMLPDDRLPQGSGVEHDPTMKAYRRSVGLAPAASPAKPSKVGGAVPPIPDTEQRKNQALTDLVKTFPTRNGRPQDQKFGKCVMGYIAQFTAGFIPKNGVPQPVMDALVQRIGTTCPHCLSTSPDNIFSCSNCSPGQGDFVKGINADKRVNTASSSKWTQALRGHYNSDLSKLSAACSNEIPANAGQATVRKCFGCGSPDHVRKDCPNPSEGDNTCRQCGKTGHQRSECPETKCYNCNKDGHIAANCTAPRNRTTHGTENKHRNHNGNSRLNHFATAPILDPSLEQGLQIRVGSIHPAGVEQFAFGTADARAPTEEEVRALEVQENTMLMYDPDFQMDYTKSDQWEFGAPNGAIVGACSASCTATRPSVRLRAAQSGNGRQ